MHIIKTPPFTLHNLLRSHSLLVIVAKITTQRLSSPAIPSSRRSLHLRSPALNQSNAIVPFDLRKRRSEQSNSNANKSWNKKKRKQTCTKPTTIQLINNSQLQTTSHFFSCSAKSYICNKKLSFWYKHF